MSLVESSGKVLTQLVQTYSIILGQDSKKSSIDVDLSSLSGRMNISCHHACIFYDFMRCHFALKVLKENSCLVEGVLHLLGNPPVKLDSQYLLQIEDNEFYFLLPVRSIIGGPLGPRHYVNHSPYGQCYTWGGALVKKGRRDYYDDNYEDDDDIGDTNSSGRKIRRNGYEGYGYIVSGGKA